MHSASHAYLGCFGDLEAKEASSLRGGVVLAIPRRLLAITVRFEAAEVSRGRIVQVDMEFRASRMRILRFHVNLAWTMAALRRAFAEVQRRSSEAGVVCVAGGGLNLLARDEVWYSADGALQAQGGRCAQGGRGVSALAHVLELHQRSWTHRRFRDGVLRGAPRIDRLYISQCPPRALYLLSATCDVGGDLLNRAYPSDHLALRAHILQARRHDPRIQTGMDRRIFEDEQFYRILRHRCQVSPCRDVVTAQAQLARSRS